jgi:hypothetical protein
MMGSGSRIRRESTRGTEVASKRDGFCLPFSSGVGSASEFGGFWRPFSRRRASTSIASRGRALGTAAVAAITGQRVLLPPGVGVDVDDVTVLREAVDERDDARGAREHGAPLLE